MAKTTFKSLQFHVRPYHYLFVLCISIILFSIPLKAETISFKQAWQRVLQNSDSLAAQRKNVERAEYLQDAASDLLLPSISIGANYMRLDQSVQIVPSDVLASMPIDNINQLLGITTTSLDALFTSTLTERDVFSSSIRAIWPIFTGGRINAAQNIAKAQHEEATHLLAMKQQAKFEDLAKYYFAVVLSKQVLATRIEVEQGLQQHLQHARKLEEQGQITKLERLQAQVSVDKAKVDRKKSQRGLEIAQVALTRLLKLPTVAEPSSPLFVNQSMPEVINYINKTLADYPGLKILDAKRKQAQGLISVEKGKYYPEVFLYGNYSLYEQDSLAMQIAPDWEIGVGINIPILDSSGRAGKTKAAHSAVMQVNYLRAQAVSDLSVLVEKTYKEAIQALEEYEGLASSLVLSQENLALRRKAFTQGLSTSINVVDAQLFISSIKTQRLVAAYHYVLSLSKLLAISSEMNSFTQYQSYQGIEVQ